MLKDTIRATGKGQCYCAGRSEGRAGLGWFDYFSCFLLWRHWCLPDFSYHNEIAMV